MTTFTKPVRVLTPIGKGIIEHRWTRSDGRARASVAVTIDDTNRRHLADENCMTPTNEIYGLFIFDACDLQKLADV